MPRRIFLSLVLFCGVLAAGDHRPLVTGVDSIGLTVSDLDRSVEFYSKVLSFEKVSETEVDGSDYEHLEGVFGLRMRTARMRLGDEFIELTEFLAPKGRPAPADAQATIAGSSTSRSSPAIWIAPTSGCARTKSSTRRQVRSVCPTGTRTPAAFKRSIFAIRTVIPGGPGVSAGQRQRQVASGATE